MKDPNAQQGEQPSYAPLAGGDVHRVVDALCSLGISRPGAFQPYWPRTRDRADISVYRCELSEVLVLSSSDHAAADYYEEKPGMSYWGGAGSRAQALAATHADDARRAADFRPLVAGKDWLDVGCGAGGVLDLLAGAARSAAGVEPQRAAARELREACGYTVYDSLEAAPDSSYDIITLFHVYEHVPDPLPFTALLARKLRPGGLAAVEVPHARDALITTYRSAPFRDFTFWSEHLILHTRQSLRRFLGAGGLECEEVQALQRYPLANHLRWLVEGRPGGHVTPPWAALGAPALDAAYKQTLAQADRTDTLLAFARKPA